MALEISVETRVYHLFGSTERGKRNMISTSGGETLECGKTKVFMYVLTRFCNVIFTFVCIGTNNMPVNKCTYLKCTYGCIGTNICLWRNVLI